MQNERQRGPEAYDALKEQAAADEADLTLFRRAFRLFTSGHFVVRRQPVFHPSDITWRSNNMHGIDKGVDRLTSAALRNSDLWIGWSSQDPGQVSSRKPVGVSMSARYRSFWPWMITGGCSIASSR